MASKRLIVSEDPIRKQQLLKKLDTILIFNRVCVFGVWKFTFTERVVCIERNIIRLLCFHFL